MGLDPSLGFSHSGALATLLLAILACPLLAFAAPEKKATVIDKALAKAFPDCEVKRVACKLDKKAVGQVRKLAAQKSFNKKAAFAYVARDADGKIVGTAFFDAHKVRTKRETLMVLVNPSGTLKGVETVVFQEPPEYIAQDAFYASLEGRSQGRKLQLGRGLDGTTGATLTCRAVADCTRRVLALHEVLGERVGCQKSDEKEGVARLADSAR